MRTEEKLMNHLRAHMRAKNDVAATRDEMQRLLVEECGVPQAVALRINVVDYANGWLDARGEFDK